MKRIVALILSAVMILLCGSVASADYNLRKLTRTE